MQRGRQSNQFPGVHKSGKELWHFSPIGQKKFVQAMIQEDITEGYSKRDATNRARADFREGVRRGKYIVNKPKVISESKMHLLIGERTQRLMESSIQQNPAGPISEVTARNIATQEFEKAIYEFHYRVLPDRTAQRRTFLIWTGRVAVAAGLAISEEGVRRGLIPAGERILNFLLHRRQMSNATKLPDTSTPLPFEATQHTETTSIKPNERLLEVFDFPSDQAFILALSRVGEKQVGAFFPKRTDEETFKNGFTPENQIENQKFSPDTDRTQILVIRGFYNPERGFTSTQITALFLLIDYLGNDPIKNDPTDFYCYTIRDTDQAVASVVNYLKTLDAFKGTTEDTFNFATTIGFTDTGQYRFSNHSH